MRRFAGFWALVAGIAVAAAAGGAAAGCHPTGYTVLDALYAALVAGVAAVCGSRAPRGVVLLATVASVPLSRGPVLLVAAGGVLMAVAAALPARAIPALGAGATALAAEATLRWVSVGFLGLTALLAGILFGFVIVAAVIVSGPRVRRACLGTLAVGALAAAVLAVPAALGALYARSAAEAGEAMAKTALSDVDGGDAPAAVEDLRTAAAKFALARRRADSWWSWGGAAVPVVAQQHRAAAILTGAGADLASRASGLAGAVDLHDLRTSQGQVDLPRIESLREPVAALDAVVAAAQVRVAQSRSVWLLPPIASPLLKLSGQLAKARSSLDLARIAVQDVPALLGAGGPKHYLVVFMTPAETRGLGGFLGAYALVSVADGRLHVDSTGRPNALEPPPGKRVTLIAPPDYIARYGQFNPQGHVQDVSYSPDFPTVAGVLAGIYPQVGGQPVDGVLALDPYALAALLQFTGPVAVAGLPEPLTAANAATVLLRQQYLIPGAAANRHDLLEQALSDGFRRLVSASLPGPRVIGDVLGPLVREGRLLFWTADPGYDPLLSRFGLLGSFPAPRPGGELFAVTLSNAANDKLDAYLTETIRASAGRSGGRDRAAFDIRLTSSAAASLPYYVAGSYIGSGLPYATDLTWLSVYSAWPLQGATLAGKPVSMSSGRELGVNVYSTYVTEPPGSTEDLDVSFSAPASGAALSLTVRQQPLALPSSMSVAVQGYPTWVLGPEEVATNEWNFGKKTKTAQGGR